MFSDRLDLILAFDLGIRDQFLVLSGCRDHLTLQLEYVTVSVR